MQNGAPDIADSTNFIPSANWKIQTFLQADSVSAVQFWMAQLEQRKRKWTHMEHINIYIHQHMHIITLFIPRITLVTPTKPLHVSALLSRHLHKNCVKLQVIPKHKPKTCFSNGELSLKHVRGFIFAEDLQVYTICVHMLVTERCISIMQGTNIKFVRSSSEYTESHPIRQ